MADIVDMRGQPILDRKTTANRRVTILAALLAAFAPEEGWIEYGDILALVSNVHGLPEETVGPEIIDAVYLLVRSGLLICDTYDHASGVLIQGADTKLMPSTVVKAYVST